MKVTSVAVVLISLLVLCDVAFSAPDCGSNGVQDQYATQYCSCFSGYAPSDSDQDDCKVPAFCPANEPIDTRTSVGGFPPFLYNVSFMGDRYNAVIRMPIVQNRRNSTVRFKSGLNTCGYPGNMWQKKANTLDCFDEFWGSIPWSSNDRCGFKKSASGPKTIYSGVLFVTYDDLVQDSLGPSFIRTVGVSLNVNVSFTTRTQVIYSLINLTPGLTFVTVTVIGQVMYDANTGLASVILRTSATWPYQVNTMKMFSTPSPNKAVILVDANYDVSSGCTNDTNSLCTQQFIMQINPTTGCNLGGQYVFNISLICRALACLSTYNAGSYSVRVYDTDVCGVGGVDVELADGSLLPFADAAGQNPSSAFLPNSDVYFAFSISSDAVTIDDITVEQITATSTNVEDVLYDTSPGPGLPKGLQVKGQAAGLTITPAITPAAPGVEAVLWFHIQLVDAISSFRVLPSQAAVVSVSIIVTLDYHGNNKRSVQYTYTNGQAASTSSQGQADIYIGTQGVTPPDNLDAAASSLSPCLFVLFALVALILNF
jgi:hypothetical protein